MCALGAEIQHTGASDSVYFSLFCGAVEMVWQKATRTLRQGFSHKYISAVVNLENSTKAINYDGSCNCTT
jgi:hypothetical protein